MNIDYVTWENSLRFACKGFFDSHVIVDHSKRKPVDSNQPATLVLGKSFTCNLSCFDAG
jgi:hypothetical protein